MFQLGPGERVRPAHNCGGGEISTLSIAKLVLV